MKLIYYIILRITLALTLILTIWAVFFYVTMIDEVNDEVDDSLEDYSETIIIRAPIKKWTKDMNRHFSKEDIYAAKKIVKFCKASWASHKIIPPIFIRKGGHDRPPTPFIIVRLPVVVKSAFSFYAENCFLSVLKTNIFGFRKQEIRLTKAGSGVKISSESLFFAKTSEKRRRKPLPTGNRNGSI